MLRARCECGEQAEAPDYRAGDAVPCRACRKPVQMPDAPIAAGEVEPPIKIAVVPTRTCPKCKREAPGHTVVCASCGFNFKTQRAAKKPSSGPSFVLTVGLWIIGCVQIFRVFQNEQGKMALNVRRKLFFIPLANATYELSKFHALVTDYRGGDEETNGVYYLSLESHRGRTVTIFRSSSERAFHALIELVATVGGLQIKRG